MATETPSKKSKVRGTRSVWLIAVACGLLAVLAAMQVLSRAAAHTTVWVLNQDVPARTQITPDMLTDMTTSVGGQPRNALDRTDVAAGTLYSKVALQAGDVLSPSVIGPLQRITTGLPDGFVAASLQVAAENAVAGKITSGDYVDIFATNEVEGTVTSKAILHRVLVLDVTVAPSEIASAATEGQVGAGVNTTDGAGPESPQVRAGIPSLYTLGVSATDAAKLALIRDKNPYVTLASNKATSSLDAAATLTGLFADGATPNSSAGITAGN